ncbi:hypothetical protein GTP46_24875 [Duganella sp. FT135W]|uniref:Uncharacterized protein n=1 Tax=Duganella flavida TaxID=2692175 RepID=A0A6L8KI48_9BURK|nr:hypothetical protein [Duganella flavida]MYM25868.1 hypothetical protein [Duganella flavida]
MGLFSRRRKPVTDMGGLGVTLIALRVEAGDVAPMHSTVVLFNAAGHARRAAVGKVACEQGEMAFCFHPGPYTVDLTPFAAAPEWGLRLRFVVDAANPRVSQQRFDLYLYSETAGRLALADFAASVQLALQAELAQGALDLPPCTTLEEWHAFRAGLNQLMYTRYGVTVDDCVPVDLGEQIDYATTLRARAQQEATRAAANAAAISAASAASAATADRPSTEPQLGEQLGASRATAGSVRAGARQPAAAEQDARALRRLFIELPALTSELRLLALPEGSTIFQQHQTLLLRLGMAALNVNTMPALAWAAPDQPLPAEDQSRRSAQTLIAESALDESWSLLARLQLAGPQQWAQLLDEADRICANLETGLSLRRVPHIPRMEPSL